MLMKGISLLQSSIQNIATACSQNNTFGKGGGHGGTDSMNNGTEIFEK